MGASQVIEPVVRRFASIFAAVAVLLALSGCDAASSRTITQSVAGNVTVEGKAAPDLAFRLASHGNTSCSGDFISLTTNASGVFNGSRPAYIGRWDVIVQDDVLCIIDGDTWRPIWHAVYGPAPSKMEFLCSRAAAQKLTCTMNGLKQNVRAP
jgi:hypothetical protein